MCNKKISESATETPPYRSLSHLTGAIELGTHSPPYKESRVCGYSKINFQPNTYEYDASLIYYENPMILFKGDATTTYPNSNWGGLEYQDPRDNPNHYMDPRLIAPLESLVNKIVERDPYIRVRITSAFRLPGNFEYSRSLHHTGMALDLTLYDTYSKRKAYETYGMLAELCVEAGFCWVYYEDRYHVHVSMATNPMYQPFLIQYKKVFMDWAPLKAFKMKDMGDHTAQHQLELEPGTYAFKFAEGSPRRYFGYRKPGYLGREDQILPEYGYLGAPIVVTIREKGTYRFTFQPTSFQYAIDPIQSTHSLPKHEDISILEGLGKLLMEDSIPE